MYHILISLLFASAFIAAMAVMALTLQAYGEKALAALLKHPLHRPPAPWRTPPRRLPRKTPAAIVRPRFSRAAA